MAAIIADGIFMKSHPSSQRVRDRINDLYVEHSRNEATGGRPKDRGRLTYAQIREAHRSGRESLQEHPTSEDKLLGEERNQDLLYGDKKEQTYVKPNLPSYFGSDAPSDISYMSGTPRGLNEESGDYGASNERWK